MSKESVVDASRPNAGRIYDYILGGNHNFEVDRQAADHLLKLIPFAAKFARLQRWALQDIAVELSEVRGYDVIVDFASGLPTNDNIHSKVKEGTTVIYSDYDPVIVEYAREILADTPNVFFFEGDARYPDQMLQSSEVKTILGDRRKVAFVHWGVSGFLEDADIARAAQSLYDWAAPGSCWAFSIQGIDTVNHPDAAKVRGIYERMGTKVYARPKEKYQELLHPWQLDEQGFVSLLEWHGFDQTEMAQEDVEFFGPMGGAYGAYLIKS
jgi:hypothetical protein